MTVQIGTPEFTTNQDDRVLDVAVSVLVRDPAASLGEIAVAAGIGRTTLHNRYATRSDLLTAVAHRAIDLVDAAIEQARPQLDQPPELGRLLELAIPIGPHLTFLLTEPQACCGDTRLTARIEALHDPIVDAVRDRLDSLGAPLAAGLPDWWVVSTLHALLHAAWQAVDAGLLAPRSAPGLVADWFLHGAAGAHAPLTTTGPPGPAARREAGVYR